MEAYSVFDIIGPVMVGPSSSHTAGAARLGKLARQIVEGSIKRVEFILYGSFARTYKGHGTGKALLAGILGLDPHDEKLAYSFEMAREKGVEFEFTLSNARAPHPNSVRMMITTWEGKQRSILGCSIGGGNVLLKEIDGIEVELTGKYDTLITTHRDRPGIVARVAKVLADHDINIAYMRVYRRAKGDRAIMVIESDQPISGEVKRGIREVEGIMEAPILNPL